MSDLETKAVEVLDKAEQGIALLTTKMAALAVEYGPDVMDATLEVARFTALGGLIKGAVSFVIFLLLAKVAFSLFTKGREFGDVARENTTRSEQDLIENRAIYSYVATVVVTAPAIIFGLMAFSRLTNIWYWLGTFNPQLYIAHRVLEGVL